MIKIFICGHGRHGKDTAGDFFRGKLGWNFECSSFAAARIFIFDELKEKYGYTNAEECYDDRHNHRKLWYDMITAYNTPDDTRLGQEIFKNSQAYVGMRRYEELEAFKNNFETFVIWIDASKRLPPEKAESCTVDIRQADIIIDNNGTLHQFMDRLKNTADFFNHLRKTNILRQADGVSS